MRKFRLLAIFLPLFAAALLLSQLDVRDGFSLTPDWMGKSDRLSRLDTLNRVLYHIQESYVDPERIKPKEMFEKALDDISAAVVEVRILRPSPKKAILVVDQERKEFDTDLATAFALRGSISDALRFIRSHKRSDISDTDLETIAINGILSTLDPHSVFLTKEMFKEMTTANTGIFGGLGIEIGIRDTKLTVIRPLKDTPASRAGLLAGDQVTKIGEDSTRNMSLDEAVSRLRGPKGTKVTMTVRRKDWPAEKDFTLVRDEINVASVESLLLPDRVGYLRIKSFQKNTGRDLNQHLKRLHAEAGETFKGLVLDLRNDPGGLLDQAIAVTDKFLKDGVIVTTVDMNSKIRKQEKASGRGTETDYPMTILVNGASASASEIVAGALQRQGRAILVGEKTFGKGTVQSIFELPEKSALKLTVAKYFTPGDISIQSVGISPEVRAIPATVSSERVDIFPSHSRISEKSLEHHFDNPETAQSSTEPIVSLRYFESRTDREIVEDETRLHALRDESKAFAEGLLKDTMIQIASDIVRRATGPERKDLLLAAKESAGWLERRETAKISAALAKRNIDWADAPRGKSGSCGVPKAASRVLEHGTRPLHAGATVRLAVTLSNPGPCTLYQAWANSSSKYYIFDDRELLFGKVPPGSSVTRDAPLEIPAFSPTSLTTLVFQFKEAGGTVPEKLTTQVAVERAATPEFAFNYDVRDVSKRAKHEADGLIEPGETVELRVRIRNTGSVESTEGVASIHQTGEKTLQFRRTHVPLPILKPKQETTALFVMEIPASFGDDSFDLDLTIADVKYRVYLSKKIGFGVVPRGKLPTRMQTVTVHEASAPIYALASATSTVIARADRGTLLTSANSFGNFTRVKLPAEAAGWIRKGSVTSGGGKAKPGKKGAAWVFSQPPKIESDLEKRVFTPVDGQFLNLEGVIAGSEPIKDLLVFVNLKKVFYQNFDEPASESSRQKFTATIPLEPGTNRILLVARDRSDLAQKEAVILQRRGSEPDVKEGTLGEEMDDFLFSPGY